MQAAGTKVLRAVFASLSFFLSMKATTSLFSIFPPTVSLPPITPTNQPLLPFNFLMFNVLIFQFSFHSAPPYRSIFTMDKNRVSGS